MADRDDLPGRRTRRRPALRRADRVAAVALAAAMVVAACSSAGGSGEGAGEGEGGGATTHAAERPGPEPPFAVGLRQLDLVDTSRAPRSVPGADEPASSERRIGVELVYPAEGDGNAPTGATAEAQPVDGRFPLVVFAHGLHASGEVYVPLAERWARAGYVVALPTFPHSSGEGGDPTDYQQQPSDVSFVIDQVLALGDDDTDPLGGLIDGDRVAVGGHSLGSATVFGVTYNSCCLDSRIDAAMSISGGGLPFEGGTYNDPPPTPLLLVHGARDEVVPISAGDATFENTPPPVHYLRFNDADHTSLFEGEDGELLATAMLAFLDARLGDDPSALEQLPAVVARSGRAELRIKP